MRKTTTQHQLNKPRTAKSAKATSTIQEPMPYPDTAQLLLRQAKPLKPLRANNLDLWILWAESHEHFAVFLLLIAALFLGWGLYLW